MTSEQQLNCIFCKEVFDDKETLQIHFRKHADPTFNKPNYKCKSPQTEVETSNEAPNTSTEIVTCDVCTEVFPTISKAITHKHKVHPDHDTKYFCEWCGKLFTLKHLYSKHLLNHESLDKAGDEVFHCDTCNVNFNIPSAMIYHNKFFHRQDMELPAIGHSKRQKFVKKELVSVYYCAFCGEEYINKVNLHKHMADDHGDENQSPDEILRCPLCEAIFYHLDAYEIHLTFHTVEDIYCSDDNVVKTDITEFTLESVPPMLEKVEEFEPDEHSNAMNIDQLMQLSDATDHDNTEKIKHKKQKKHKKSKKEKSAITLDQFLNMNADVFGEGLDFQGVEEVPTKIVTKQLKIKPKPRVVSGAQAITKKDLDKLKQQGIVVKMKSTHKIPMNTGEKVVPGTKIVSVKSVKVINDATASSKCSQVSPGSKLMTKNPNDEILSKFMNQSHSQIKIIKNPPLKKASEVPQIKNCSIKPVSLNKVASFETMRSTTPENIEVECDLLPRDSEPSSEIETEHNESSITVIKKSNENITLPVSVDEPSESKILSKPDLPDKNDKTNNYVNALENDALDETSNLPVQEINKLKSLKVLKSISQDLTIKPLNTDLLPSKDKIICNKTNDCPKDDLLQSSDENAESDIEEKASAVANTLSSGIVTTKKEDNALQQVDENVKSTVQTVKKSKDNDYEQEDSNIKSDENTSVNLKCEKQDESGNPLNVLKNLDVSVTSRNQVVKKIDYDKFKDSQDPEQTQSINVIKKEIPTQVNKKSGNSLNILKSLGITVKSNNQTIKKEMNTDISNITKTQNTNMTNEETESKQGEQLRENTGNSLNVLKRLGITVKSTNIATKNDDNDFEDFEDKIDNLTSDTGNVLHNKIPNISKEDKMGKSLNALKNLGIIVKSSKQDEDQHFSEDDSSIPPLMIDEESTLNVEFNDTLSTGNNKNISTMIREQNSQHKVQTVMKSSNQTMTLKSLKQSQTVQSTSNIIENKSNNFEQKLITSNMEQNKFHKVGNVAVKFPDSIKVITPCHSPKTINNPISNKLNQGEDIYERNSNLTKKHLVFKNPIQKNMTDNALKNLHQNITVKALDKNKNKKVLTVESEIYNIDDSEDEEQTQAFTEENGAENFKHSESEIVPKVTKTVTNTLQNIPKEAIGQQVGKKTKYDNISSSTDNELHGKIYVSNDQVVSPSVAKLMNNKNISLKNLPNLSKAVVKSANVSSIHQDKKLSTSNDQKKTINSFDDFFSNESSDDDDVPLHISDNNHAGNTECTEDIPLTSLNKSNSDDDFEDDQFNNDSQTMIDKLKNINQNLIIRSNKTNDHIKKSSKMLMQVSKDFSTVKNESRVLKRDFSELNTDMSDINDDLSIKSFKQLKTEEEAINTPMSQNKTIVKQNVGRPQNHTKSMNYQQMSATNSVNQEVTTSVKTVQTKTIVQEITTTVTRTIKTVNQEVVSENQTISNFAGTSKTPMVVHGMKIANQMKKVQGFPIRQPSYVHRPRIRPMVPTRPSMNTAIRSSTPIPFRPPGFKQVRPAVQRIPIAKNVQTQQGKTVRIAPHVVQQQKKNTAQPEPEGHFSCFKKPKQSLIPDPMSIDGEGTIHVAASSHIIKSNHNSSTKTVKGNTVMSSTQMKSEVHTSSQQMSKLGNVPGLSIVKNSQSKQVVKDVNQCVVGGTKRTTLEAIEKLHRLGLSVKKPRVDELENSDVEDEEHDGSLLAIESGGG